MLFIASDHAGFELKKKLLENTNLDLIDLGPYNSDSVDYPDLAHLLCRKITKSGNVRGILLCGSGIGMSMTANRYPFVRAALCHCPEFAELSRKHNNANVLVMPARFIDFETAIQCINIFLDTEFEGGRHQRRIKKVNISFYDYIIDNVKNKYEKTKEAEEKQKKFERKKKKDSKRLQDYNKHKINDMWKSNGFSIN